MGYENENRRNEITEAGAEVLRAAAWVVPIIGMIFAMGLFVSQVLSTPFEITCRSVARQYDSQPLQAKPAEELIQPIKR